MVTSRKAISVKFTGAVAQSDFEMCGSDTHAFEVKIYYKKNMAIVKVLNENPSQMVQDKK